ncbi:DUF3265 domain-containing protein [Vibrio cholerae]|nr:DUF3265 domain-containing protein [Vibrio cholerae]
MRDKYYCFKPCQAHNKRFKRDSQRAAFLICVGFGDYGVMLKISSSVGCPLSGR